MHYSLRLLTDPLVEPLTLDEAKKHCRVDHDDEDELIQADIATAREQCEAQTGRQLIEATYWMYLDYFPCWEIVIPKPPLLSIETFEYTDTNGATQTLTEGTHFKVDKYGVKARVEPLYGKVWPYAREEMNAVRIKFKAGYGANRGSVPGGIKKAMKIIVGELFVQRQESSPVRLTGVPLACAALLSPHLTEGPL
jgi:uncharacterized phiE125 gp8 family phage protein